MRALERLLVVLLAVTVLVLGAVGLIEIGLAAADRPPWLAPLSSWAESVRDLEGWDDPAVRTPAVVLVAVGAALVVGALWPRRPELLTLGGGTEDRHDQVTRRGMEALLEEAVLDDDDVATASVRVGRRQITAAVGVAARSEPGAVRERVAGLVRSRLTDAGVADDRRIVVDATSTAGRVR